jgi:hypothetical protein
MVGYRQAMHTHLFSSFDQLGDAAHAIKQTILSMDVEMIKHGTF